MASHFVTLTYAQEVDRHDLCDFQSWIRLLRKRCGARIRYFGCGELGGRTGRVHFHALLFCDRPVLQSGLYNGAKADGEFSPLRLADGSHGRGLHKAWPHGGVFVGDVSPRAIRYVVGDMSKSGPSGGRPIRLMSRRPGLGLPGVERLGAFLASQVSELACLPAVVRVGGTLYTFDKSMSGCLERGFLGAGGVITGEGRSDFSFEVEAVLFGRSGLRGSLSAQEAAALQREGIRRAERGLRS